MAVKKGTTNTLYMVLNMDNGKTHTVKLANPKPDLTELTAHNAMNTIIQKEALLVGTAKAQSINEAYRYTVKKEELD